MIRLTRREFNGMAAALAASPLAAAAQSGRSSDSAIAPPGPQFFATLTTLMEITAVPAIAIGIVRQDQPLWERSIGVADASSKTPLDTSTMFPAASLGKPVAAWLALQLVAEGKLDLDRPLKAYVPDHAPEDARGDRVTARHVLSHCSGFRNWRNSVEQPLRPDFDPGARFQYSGEGFYYLQRAVERINGRAFELVVQQRLLEPLGMRSSTYAWRDDTDRRLVTGHNRGTPVRGQHRDFCNRLFQYAAGQGKPLAVFTHEDVVAAMAALKPSPPVLPNFMIPNCAGSMLTTMAEYCAFVRRAMQAAGGASALPAAQHSAMFSPQTKINSALSWGLGWGLERAEGRDYAWHWGDNGNYKNFVLMHLPSRSAVVVFTNGNNGMRLCEAAVTAASGHRHPAFDWL